MKVVKYLKNFSIRDFHWSHILVLISSLALTLYAWNISRQHSLELSKLKMETAGFSEANIILLGGLLINLLLLWTFIVLNHSRQRAIRHARKMSEIAEQQKAKAVNSAKLASLGEMAGRIAHEINNPLAIITGSTSLLDKIVDENDPKDAQIIKIRDRIDSTVFRVARIIKSMRALSRDASLDPFEQVDAGEIIEDCISLCSEKFRAHGVKLIYDKTDNLPKIYCRRTEISQVIVNLLTNSFDAVHDKEEAWVQIDVSENNSHAIIKVTDSGAGIPDEIAQNILKPFFTTKQIGQGTGLGLSISKSIMDAHDAYFYLDTKSKHTCFVLEFKKYNE